MIIYKTTNLINGKIYIGQTVGWRKSYIGSGIAFTRAIKKYGRESFKFEIIVEGDFNRYLTDELEKHYIRLYNSTDKRIGYNISPGGNVPVITNAERFKGSRKLIGVKKDEAFREKCRIRRLGTKASEETRKKMSEARLGYKFSEESKMKQREAALRKPFHGINPEVRRKCIEANRGRIPPNKGKSYSLEIKLKMRVPILQYNLDNQFIKEWTFATEAAESLNIGRGQIGECCRGKIKSYRGFIWKYKDESLRPKE